MKWLLRHAGLTDVGRQREINEDAFCALPPYSLFMVADGMGGHKAGDVASRMATDAIAEFFRATDGEDSTWPFHFDPQLPYDENRLIAGVKLANRRIYEASTGNQQVRGMGTTIVACLFSETAPRVYVGHVGDSRCYRLRAGAMELLTRDHSLVNDYRIAMPHLTEEQMTSLPKNVITRALGMNDSVVVDVRADTAEEGDLYLLCSDGLSGAVSEADITAALKSREGLESVCQRLVDMANEGGGEDNITALLVDVAGVEKDEKQEGSDEPSGSDG